MCRRSPKRVGRVQATHLKLRAMHLKLRKSDSERQFRVTRRALPPALRPAPAPGGLTRLAGAKGASGSGYALTGRRS